ncbi:PAS domain S-box protein [Sphingomicrobium sp. XHP0239]|uniref:PAS domain S-box protein n=1 Tax=Sphingomicrobium maritimum TaxID=3133972 RepID=UPI0031CC3812
MDGAGHEESTRRKAVAGEPPAAGRGDHRAEAVPDTTERASSDDLRELLATLPAGFDLKTLFGIADALPVMLAYCDASLHYRFVNRPLADWMQVDRSQMLGRTVEEVMGAKAFAGRRELLERALAGEKQWFAADYDHPALGPLTTQADYIPNMDDTGTVVGLTIIVQDVTDKRVAGRALSESETRFRRIADSAPVPMWVSRLDGTREFVNQAYAAFFDTDKDSAAAIGWEDRVHPDDAQAMHDALVEGLKSEAPFGFEARAERADGVYRWMQAMVQPRRDADGRIIGYIGAASDITLAKQAEHELRAEVRDQRGEIDASEARFRAVFESLDMVGIMDLEGRHLEMNASALDALGLSNEEVRGLHSWDLPMFANHPASVEALKDLVAAGARGESASVEIDVTIDGRAGIHVCTITPIFDRNGKPRLLVGQARDTTALKQTQDQLRQAQKMEALGQLTGGIAHDFNNLLTVVVGGLDLISKRVEDEKLKRYADNALAAAQRGARLTGQLLTFSRVQKLQVQSVHLGRVLNEMEPLFANALGARFAVKWDIEDRDVHILADTTQLEVALLNLAINARDAMGERGTLTVSTRRVELSGDAEMMSGDFVELVISDTGSGMSAEVRERVFEPFFTTKEVGKGTGLGLSMVYGMVHQSGGTARIDSVEGEGTSVRLFFRVAAQDADTVERQTSDPDCARSIAGRRILVIDDDEDVRTFVEQTLADMGAEVTGAADGTAGLAAYAETRPEVIVLDYAMPGLSGAEVAAAILDETPGQPILFISGYSETAAIRKIAPDAPLLAKPFSPGDLEDKLCTLLPG